jgi:hypothetical protein
MMRRLLVAMLAIWGTAHGATADIHLRTTGQVAKPGELTLPGAARYADAAIAAAPLPDAYVLGAALLRPSLQPRQHRLRAGIVYDLGEIERRARNKGDDRVADRAHGMATWIGDLPVTGREPALLDPRVVEVTPARNHPVMDGDELHFPVRPATVRIVGAVGAVCTVALVPLQDARRYLDACGVDATADADVFYVIQPDGEIFRQGRALWNRGEPMSLAPGATLYVPLAATYSAGVDATLDHDIAAFLATQVLP